MEAFKRIIIIIVVVVAGYFIYQNFFTSSLDNPENNDDNISESTGPVSAEDLPPIPDSCTSLEKDLENAIYGVATHEISFTQRNRISREFAACLGNADFSEEQIQATIAQIQKKVDEFAKKDGN